MRKGILVYKKLSAVYPSGNTYLALVLQTLVCLIIPRMCTPKYLDDLPLGDKL